MLCTYHIHTHTKCKVGTIVLIQHWGFSTKQLSEGKSVENISNQAIMADHRI